ncbi:MAG: thiamine pyrophosphate-dependent enzyme [Candidatus Thermoplasmatota archaeon]
MSKNNISTTAEITWCPGCGNFGILNALKKSVEKLDEKGVKRKNIAVTSGIGCHGKIIDYVSLNGLYSIHGRSMATGQGMKIGNPDLKILTFAGDGDAYGEGISHMIFAAKRNIDVTVVVHNNGTYALTTGQFSPTSYKGFKGPSTPEGNVEKPLNPLSLMLEAGASFVARGYAGELEHLSDLIVEGVLHEGFSFIDVLQPSVVFHDTYEEYNELTEIIKKRPKNYEDAVKLAKQKEKKLPIGVFYKMDRPTYHKELFADWNPVENKLDKKSRRKKIKELIKKR